MKGRDVLEMQLTGSFGGLRDRLDTVTDDEWITRGIPRTSLLGFTFWHAARTIDWAVHCAIQGVPEVADGPQWGFLGAAEFAYGAGITDEEADRVAHSVSRDQVRTYLDALQPATLGWLKQQTDSDLDRTPDFEVHQRAKPRYLTEPLWAQVSDLAGLPAWQILSRPCVSHIRVHAGQIDILVRALRAKTPAA